MKNLYLIFGVLLIISCNEKIKNIAAENNQVQVSEPLLSAEDSIAAISMDEEVVLIGSIADSLAHGNKHNLHHWDSLYKHHDSLFWHHHNKYHHNTHLHDDHVHHWVSYDTTIHHTTHYHHRYNSKHHDSLVTVPNNHHDSSNVHHYNGHHGLRHHHLIDSLSQRYVLNRP